MKPIYEYLVQHSDDLGVSGAGKNDRFWIESIDELTIEIRHGSIWTSENPLNNWIDQGNKYIMPAKTKLFMYIDTNKFSISGRYKIGGNLLGLFSRDGDETEEIYRRDIDGCFKYTFMSSDLVDASLLTIPRLKNVEFKQFKSMFASCNKLERVNPKLLSNVQLGEKACCDMFKWCTSLKEAPELPATDLVEYCYENMFSGCTSLTKAPKLPATTMKYRCYTGMFSRCTSLTKAPDLPATNLAQECYESMFEGCTSLTKAPDLPAMRVSLASYRNMFQNCVKLETAPDLPAMKLDFQCYCHMFEGCTSLKNAPKILPATRLTEECYCNMFKDCTLLQEAPELMAEELTSGCYLEIFQGCTSLNLIKMHASSTYSDDWKIYADKWLDGVGRKGTIYMDPDLNLINSKNGIYRSWKRFSI